MQKIRILDDIYGEYIYKSLSKILPNFEYPIKENVVSPIPYLSQIKDGDIILLDNYFMGEYYEEPLGDDFLWQYLKLGYACDIICLSNVGVNIVKRFEQWSKVYNQGDVVGFVPSKDGREIADIIEERILLV